MGKYIKAMDWYGGKYSHLNFILPFLPSDADHFIDVFGGSAAVLLNAGPYKAETYNDLDGDLVNFFRVLRDDGDELIRRLQLTPYARQEMMFDRPNEPIERARWFYCRAAQMRNANAQSGSVGSWSFTKNKHMPLGPKNVHGWLAHVRDLPHVVARLKRVQVEHYPAMKILDLYDSAENALFYIDPPYLHSTRVSTSTYHAEMSDDEHVALAHKLHSMKSRIVLSGYQSDLYDDLYADWISVVGPEKHLASSPERTRKMREVVWMNFEPKQRTLF